MRTLVAHPATEPDCQVGEGPVWHDGTLTWVDIPAGHVHHATAALKRLPTTRLDRPVGAVVPAGNGWLVAAGTGFLHVDAGGHITELAQPEAGNPGVRMNDGKCDPFGRFWAGSLSGTQTVAGSLYRLDADGTVHRILSDIGISNGIGWSPDGGKMYYVDSAVGTLDVFDYDLGLGLPRRRHTLITFSKPCVPDGLCIDDDGCIWLALWNGAAIHRYTPDGYLDTIVAVPVKRPTSCCFAGDTLYITTARAEHPEPMAGAVFACHTSTSGPASTPYQRDGAS